MAHLEFPGGESWPEADLPAGTFEVRHVFVRFRIPENATAVMLIFGLEKVTGRVRFSNLSLSLGQTITGDQLSERIDLSLFTNNLWH